MRTYFLLFSLLFVTTSFASGQTLQKEDTSEVRFLNSRKFFIYKVEKGETLFSISQKFKIPQEELLQFNSEVKSDGLKAKMKIWIPAYSLLNKSLTVDRKSEDKISEDKIFKVAILTTLNLPKLYLEKPEENDSTFVDEPIDKDLKHNIEFVECIRFALERLSVKKRKIELFVIDDESDSVKIRRSLRADMNISAIITNETGALLKYISSICQNRNIRLFATAVNTSEIIKNNKNAVALLPSSLTQCRQAGYFASLYFPNALALFITSSNSKENERTMAFKEGWLTSGKPMVQCNYAKNQEKGITDSLPKNKQAIVFIPSSNEDMVTSLLTSLKEKKDTGFKFSVIGLPTWQGFETVDPRLMEVNNVYLFNSGQVNYNGNDLTFLRKYLRDNFNTEPGETGVIAMDAASVIVHALDEGGNDITETNLKYFKGLFTDYQFTEVSKGSALENKTIHIYKSGDDSYTDLSKNVLWK